MLFSTFEFLFLFLPVVLGGFLFLGRVGGATVIRGWLVGASLFFYAVWRIESLPLILGSVAGNYLMGLWLADASARLRRWLLFLGVGLNLLVLGIFKYAGFLAENLVRLGASGITIPDIVLPLGISFFTFQQIAYLADVHGGQSPERNVLNYAFFVTFFPQLVAGPIVHHGEIMPQLDRPGFGRPKSRHLSIGVVMFVSGLAKKLIVADELAVSANAAFAVAARGEVPDPTTAWLGVLAYTGQIYFDFSGYSDMAIGLARMFGVRLPLNFFSPYRSTSIIDFWRRWHITLSRFLRDYLYIPLGGNRCGRVREMGNVLVVMFLGGLWHGAGWTFVIWGLLHGLYLSVNHLWRKTMGKRLGPWRTRLSYRLVCWAVTFLAVMAAWVFFRADSFAAAGKMFQGLLGTPGIAVKDVAEQLPAIAAALLIAWLLPNSAELWRSCRPALNLGDFIRFSPGKLRFRLRPAEAFLYAIFLVLAVAQLTRVTPFLYFNF